MILNIDRGHIHVQLGEKMAAIPGEMLFPENKRLGFVVYLDQIDYWEPKTAKQPISEADIKTIVDGIQAEFKERGHMLEFESA
ncbi:Imm74 family immunity protein [Massilia sp. Leaf139]|uniref:Imm74 family immunity protein n=1 Tax=Massilia sp. Leaf139 TaxID=1736272 RepID=UPI0006F6399C|nr:Imm74 family immunity protein [Massilia sp. Leaf139]KQQ87864.1 hypothetical protein ASF77_14110 [Massilia sp. Leaf139]